MDVLDYFSFGHVSFIHFPIVCFVFGAISAYIILAFKIYDSLFTDNQILFKFEKVLRRVELISWLNIIIGWLTLPLVGILGLIDAKTLNYAVNTDLLAFKIQLFFIVFFMFIPPIYLKLYLNKIGNGEKIYNKFAYIISYIIPISLGTFLVLIIAGAGGRFVFGHSLFDNVGLGFLIPDSFNYLTYTSNFKLDFISEILFSLQGIIILSFLLIILLGFPFYKEKSERIKKSV